MARFPKKTCDHFFPNTSHSLLIRKDTNGRLALCLGVKLINPTLIACYNIVHLLRIAMVTLSNINWHLFTRCSFCSSVKEWGTQLAEIFLTFKCSCNIVFNAVTLIVILSCIMIYVIRPSCFNFFHTAEMVSGSTAVEGLPGWGSSCKRSLPLLNYANPLKQLP